MLTCRPLVSTLFRKASLLAWPHILGIIGFGDFHSMMCIQSSISLQGMCRVVTDAKVQRVQRPTSPPHKPLAGRCLATSTLKLVSDTYYMAPVQIISWISFSRDSVKNWRVWRECSVLATTLRRHQLPGLWFWLILWDVGQPGKCLEMPGIGGLSCNSDTADSGWKNIIFWPLACLRLGHEAKEKIDQYTRPDEGLETPGLEERLPGSKGCDDEIWWNEVWNGTGSCCTL